MTVKHELVNGTLTRESDGIMAKCTCGWVTRGRFSSFAASAAFQEHQESPADPPPPPWPESMLKTLSEEERAAWWAQMQAVF